MPTVAHTRQAFTIDGRRHWIVAASISYARIEPSDWPARLADVRQAGCNTVEVAVPWLLHEPRPGRFDFEGPADLGTFLEHAKEAGLHVILRIGPYVGDGYDGGGLPGWLVEIPPPPPPTRATVKSRMGPKEKVSRTASEVFLDRTTQWFKALFEVVAPLQVTEDGPVLMAQVEHRWLCDHHEAAEAYLGELVRMARESGLEVPLLNANDLWAEGFGTIDTWQGSAEGSGELLANLRQLRTIRDETPRVVSRYEVAPAGVVERPRPEVVDADLALHGLASILAAGAQPVIAPLHGGTNFGALGGRLAGSEPGEPFGTATHCPAVGAPIGDAGDRGPLFRRLRRLAHFASSFGHVFGDLDPEFHSTVQLPPIPHSGLDGAPARVVAVPQRGTAGRVLFVFADRPGAETTLLLDDGRSLPVELGDQCVGWFALDVDLGGRAKLDFSNCCPAMFVGRSILVFAGTAGSEVIISIGDTPMQATVPTTREPEVTELQGITVVIVSQEMLDETHATDSAVFVNVSGLDPTGRPLASAAGGDVSVIRTDEPGLVSIMRAADVGPPIPSFGEDAAAVAARSRKKRTTKKKSKTKKKTTRTSRAAASAAAMAADLDGPVGLADWEAAPSEPRVLGDSPRFAPIHGPASLAACGARSGLGWYRCSWTSKSSEKRTILPLGAGNRVRFWMDGTEVATWGVGPDAIRQPFDVKPAKGVACLTALAQTMGRVSSGNDLDRRVGLHGALAEVKKLTIGKPKVVDLEPMDPFSVRGFFEEAEPGIVMSRQFSWTISHSRKTSLAVHIADAPSPGFVLVNGHVLGFHAGATGMGWTTFTVDPAAEWFKRGKNELRFAPLESVHGDGSDVAKVMAVYDIEQELGGNAASWAFEKWSPPTAAHYEPYTGPEAKELVGDPCWWRCRFDVPVEATLDDLAPGARPAVVRVDLSGMGAGAVFVNGHDLGRFAVGSAGRGGTKQARLVLPAAWLRPYGNVLTLFDETGAAPTAVRLELGGHGDLDT